MDFSFTEEQDMLRISARDFLARECPKARVRELGKDEEAMIAVWHRMAELGWMGLVFPEEYGGMAASFMDLVILMEEMGRNILPGPFFSTIALCALGLLEYGSRDQKARFLPRIARARLLGFRSGRVIRQNQSFRSGTSCCVEGKGLHYPGA